MNRKRKRNTDAEFLKPTNNRALAKFLSLKAPILELRKSEVQKPVGNWGNSARALALKGIRPPKQRPMSEQEYFGMHAGAKPELFRFAEKLRANMTEAEMELWDFLRLKPNGFKFRRQHPFGRYILDFYCHKAKLAIEIDGKYHELPEQKQLDETRTNEIRNNGIREIRFTNAEVINQFEKVKSSILGQLT